MFSKLLRRFRVTGPLMVLAIVTALTVAGVPAVAGPVAETAGVPKKVVKIVKRAMGLSRKAHRRSTVALKTARNAEGTPGPQGPVGPKGDRGANGANGANGADGADGADGSDGADGKTVLNGAGSPSDAADGVDGDFYVDTTANEMYGPKASGAWPADGVALEGSPWTAGGTLPSGETLTGAWSMGMTSAAGPNFVHISFPIRLVASADVDQQDTIPIGGADPSNPDHEPCIDDNGTPGDPSDDILGTAENPIADPGHLCIYTGHLQGSPAVGGTLRAHRSPSSGFSPSGAVLTVNASAAGEFAFGTWAVTAP